jgi:hypothetical protein
MRWMRTRCDGLSEQVQCGVPPRQIHRAIRESQLQRLLSVARRHCLLVLPADIAWLVLGARTGLQEVVEEADVLARFLVCGTQRLAVADTLNHRCLPYGCLPPLLYVQPSWMVCC